MTAVLEALDLDEWIVFSTGDDEPCEGDKDRCRNEAVALAVFAAGCGCRCPEVRMCVWHRDDMIAYARHWGCDCDITCSECGAAWVFLRMEPVR